MFGWSVGFVNSRYPTPRNTITSIRMSLTRNTMQRCSTPLGVARSQVAARACFRLHEGANDVRTVFLLGQCGRFCLRGRR
jgi:hypothetical protein